MVVDVALDADEWVTQHAPALLRFAHLVTGDRDAAQDAVQDALADALASGLPSCIEIPVTLDPSPLTEAVIARGGVV